MIFSAVSCQLICHIQDMKGQCGTKRGLTSERRLQSVRKRGGLHSRGLQHSGAQIHLGRRVRPTEEENAGLDHAEQVANFASTSRLTCLAPAQGFKDTHIPCNGGAEATTLDYVFVSSWLSDQMPVQDVVDLVLPTDHKALSVILLGKEKQSRSTGYRKQQRKFVRRKWCDWQERAPGQFQALLRPDAWGTISQAEANIAAAGAASARFSKKQGHGATPLMTASQLWKQNVDKTGTRTSGKSSPGASFPPAAFAAGGASTKGLQRTQRGEGVLHDSSKADRDSTYKDPPQSKTDNKPFGTTGQAS